jgi:hypothetical protein
MLAQLRGMGDVDWLVAARVHMQGRRRSQGIIGESPMCAWQIVDDSGVGVAVVVVILTEVAVGSRGRMTALMDRRWKSETGASNFEAGATGRGRGESVVAAAWLSRGAWCVLRNKQL